MAKRTSLTDLMQQTNADAVRRATAPLTVKPARKVSKKTTQAEQAPEMEKIQTADEDLAAKNQIIKATIYLPLAVYDQLRSLHFDEQRGRAKRIKMHDYFLESLDLLFKQRGLKPIADLVKK